MLFTIGGIYTYAIVHLAAVGLFAALAAVLLRRAGILARHAAILTGAYVLANFLGGKVLFDLKTGGGHTLLAHPSIEHFLEGGYWGWQLALLPFALAYPFALGLPRAAFLRAATLALLPVLSVQKVACFLSGCCHGRPTALPWGVVFPSPSSAGITGVPVHPLQLYDAALPLVVLAIILALERRAPAGPRPDVFPLFVGLYALSRLATEMLRPVAGGGLLPSQWAEAAAVAGAAALLVLARERWERLLGVTPLPRAPARRTPGPGSPG